MTVRQVRRLSLLILLLTRRVRAYIVYMLPSDRSASTVASIVKTLEEYGAMAYTTVVASTASELALYSISLLIQDALLVKSGWRTVEMY